MYVRVVGWGAIGIVATVSLLLLPTDSVTWMRGHPELVGVGAPTFLRHAGMEAVGF